METGNASAAAGPCVTESLVHGEDPWEAHLLAYPAPHNMAVWTHRQQRTPNGQNTDDTVGPILWERLQHRNCIHSCACLGTPQTWLRLNFLPEESPVGEQIRTRWCKLDAHRYYKYHKGFWWWSGPDFTNINQKLPAFPRERLLPSSNWLWPCGNAGRV